MAELNHTTGHRVNSISGPATTFSDGVPTLGVIRLYAPMKANPLIKGNIDTLLRVRHQTRKDLAVWCFKSESWISKIFREARREFSFKDLDRIAEFFGIAAYQLLQPGISPLTERRSGLERRSRQDRRLGHPLRHMLDVGATIDAAHPRRTLSGTQDDREDARSAAASLPDSLRRELRAIEAKLAALHAHADPGGQAASPRKTRPSAGKGR